MSTAYSGQANPVSDSDKRDSGSRSAMSEVKKDAAAIRDDLGVLKEDAMKMTTDAAAGAKEALRHGRDSISDVTTSAGDSAKQYYKTTCDTVRERPLTSLALAIGAGVLVGRLLGRR